jgi:homoserine O-acetyltransferase
MPTLAGYLFQPGQPLDAQRYYVVLPDGIGEGGSSKPSGGMPASFPRYGYIDQVEAQHAMLKGWVSTI